MSSRIIVFHLDQYFMDQRKCSKLYVDERFKTINDLQKYIRNVFGITSKFCLLDISTYPHSLLPRNENIKILEGVDHVIVQEVTPDFKINREKESNVLRKQELQNNGFSAESNGKLSSTKMVTSVNRETIDNIKNPLNGNIMIDIEMMPPVEDVQHPEHSSSVARKSNLTQAELIARKSSLTAAELIARKSIQNNTKSVARKSSLTAVESIARKSIQNSTESVARKSSPTAGEPIAKKSFQNSTESFARISSPIIVESVGHKNVDKVMLVNNESKEILQRIDEPKFIIHSVETVNLPTVMEDCEEQLNNKGNDESAVENGNDAETSVCGTAENYPENVTTRSRKRTRKRKRSSRPDTPVSLTKDVSLLRKAVEVCSKRPSRASHIRFDEMDEQLDSSFRSDIGSKQVDNLLLSETINSTFNLSAIADLRIKPKIVQGFPSNKENIPDTNNENFDETRASAWEDLLKEFNPRDYQNITELPAQDDIIAFRMLRMSDNYEPVLSNYVVAMVLNVEKRGQIQDSNVQLQVLAGLENCKQPTGKFDLPEDLMNGSTSDNSTLFMKWMNIVEPKKII